MCLELTYTNSEYCGLVEFSYLAVGDKIIVNKSHLEQDDGEEFINTHGGTFNQHLWIQWCADDQKPVLTALLSYQDTDEYDGSLCQQLTLLHNMNCYDELVSNIIDMYCDVVNNSGFGGTYIGDMLEIANQGTDKIYWRTVDFQMHEPTVEDVHPGYDT